MPWLLLVKPLYLRHANSKKPVISHHDTGDDTTSISISTSYSFCLRLCFLPLPIPSQLLLSHSLFVSPPLRSYSHLRHPPSPYPSSTPPHLLSPSLSLMLPHTLIQDLTTLFSRTWRITHTQTLTKHPITQGVEAEITVTEGNSISVKSSFIR